MKKLVSDNFLNQLRSKLVTYHIKLGAADLAEDFTQEVLIVLFEKDLVKHQDVVWIAFRIAKNRWINHYKKTSRHPIVELCVEPSDKPMQIVEFELDVPRIHEKIVAKCTSTPKQKATDTLMLRRKGYSFRRIAKELNVSERYVIETIKRNGPAKEPVKLKIYKLLIGGYTYGEIAEELGISRAYVLTRSRDLLKLVS